MTQVSRPMLIALVGTLAFAAVWFTVLRPSSSTTEEPAATTAPAPAAASDASSAQAAPAGGTGVTGNVAKAQAAADTASADAKAAATADAATPATGSTPATGQAADATATPSATGGASGAVAPAKSTKVTVDEDAPPAERAIIRDLAAGKVVVMLFWDSKAADDREARRAVRRATSGRKNVAVRLVPARDVGAYEAITSGVTIERSPTTMVIGPERKAVTISGLVDELEIRQAIARMAPRN